MKGAASWAGSGRSVVLVGSLPRALPHARDGEEICPAHLSLRRMNSAAFIVIAVLTLAAALAAATLPKLVHAALSFALAFVGVAAFYFLLGAEFVGLVQVFVYVGAVAVLIVFTILLTRRDVEKDRGFNWSGALIALAVFAGLIWAILKTTGLSRRARHRSCADREANRRSAYDGLRLAAPMRRRPPHRRLDRRAGSRDGGKTVSAEFFAGERTRLACSRFGDLAETRLRFSVSHLKVRNRRGRDCQHDDRSRCAPGPEHAMTSDAPTFPHRFRRALLPRPARGA